MTFIQVIILYFAYSLYFPSFKFPQFYFFVSWYFTLTVIHCLLFQANKNGLTFSLHYVRCAVNTFCLLTNKHKIFNERKENNLQCLSKKVTPFFIISVAQNVTLIKRKNGGKKDQNWKNCLKSSLNQNVNQHLMTDMQGLVYRVHPH